MDTLGTLEGASGLGVMKRSAYDLFTGIDVFMRVVKVYSIERS